MCLLMCRPSDSSICPHPSIFSGPFQVWNIVFDFLRGKLNNLPVQPPPVGHTLYRSLLNIHPAHMCTSLPCVCLWTFIINSHNIFSCIPIDPPVLKQASFAVSSLTFFSPLLSLPFPNSWQPVQILAVCCSPLILCQTFLLHKYTRISQEEQN